MIEINNCTKEIKLNFKPKQIFNLIIKTTNKLLNINDKRLIVVNFISNDEMKEINHKFRNNNKITDVLSFSFDEAKVPGPIIGEIYICIEQAFKQAEEYEHSNKREICFLFTHGLLHLYGFDHQSENDSKKMFYWQNEILNNCSILRGRDNG